MGLGKRMVEKSRKRHQKILAARERGVKKEMEKEKPSYQPLMTDEVVGEHFGATERTEDVKED